MNEDNYRLHLRDHFMNQLQNRRDKKMRGDYKDQSVQNQRTGLEASSNEMQRNFNHAPTSGGDADRMLYSKYNTTHHGGDSCRMYNPKDTFSLKQLQTISGPSTPTLTSNANRSSRKYRASVADEITGEHKYIYENDSCLDGLDNSSEDSAKSQKSVKTIVSRKSSQDLRKLVTSQCKLHEVIGETIKQMCNTDVENTVENNAYSLQDQRSNLTFSQCKRCADQIYPVTSQKDVMTEIGKDDFLDCRNTTTLTISVDDVINSRLINPMIHKLHRMYLNNLKEEMSLMEDLERLPNKVNEVYKSIIYKQKDK